MQRLLTRLPVFGRCSLSHRPAGRLFSPHSFTPFTSSFSSSRTASQISAMSSPNSSSPSESFQNFDLIKRVKLDFTDVTVSKWKSRVTGLSVIHLDYEGAPSLLVVCLAISYSLFTAPLVSGYFVVATESRPHMSLSQNSRHITKAYSL
jgi:hypothetical protein